MPDRIKGIVVEIGGDTVGLSKALKGVNQTSRDLQKELRDVQKLLKFDPNNAELLAQRQKLLNEQIENTEKKLKALKDAEADVQKQFERGDIGAEQYRNFQRELQDTESYLRNTQNALNDMQKEQEQVAESTKELDRIFDATNSSLEDFEEVLGTRLVRAIQQGTASSKDLRKAFDLIGQEAIGADADIDKVRQALRKLETGESSIQGVRKELQKLQGDAEKAEGAIEKLEGKIGGLEGTIGAIGAGLGLNEIFEKSMSMAELDTQIDISMDVPEESKKSVKKAVKSVEAYGVDVQDALQGVRRQFQLNSGLTDEENQRIIKGAATINKAYQNVDFAELIQETHEMALGMNMSHDEALGMTKALLDVGFPDDQLDIISEYGQQLTRAGYDASEVQAIFSSGIETGTWNIDNLMDGLKEGRILLSEFGAEVPKALQDSLKGTEITAKQVQDWGKAMNEGGEKGKTAMMDVAIALSGIEDETKRNELGVQMFGGMWEEQGRMITETIIGAKDKTVDLAEGQAQLAEDTAKLDASPQVQLNNALTAMTEALTPLLTKVSEFITMVAEWVQENPELAATILAVVTGVGILLGIIMSLFPLLMGIASVVPILSAVFAVLTSPITLVVLAIIALIAIGVLLYKNWDTIKEKASQVWQWVKEAFGKLKDSVKEKLGETWDKIKEIWGDIIEWLKSIDLKQIGKDIIQGLINGIGSMAKAVSDKAKEVASGIGEKVASILKLGSPSKVMIGMGKDTGKGLAIGLKDSLGMIKNVSAEMANLAIPDMQKSDSTSKIQASQGKSVVVNLHSPKALDVREASRQFNRTVNKMSLMW